MKAIAGLLISTLFFLVPAWATEKAWDTGQLQCGTKDPSREEYERNWYIGLGTTNYHPRLHESEKEIDRRLNRFLDWMSFWEKPTTFADWRDLLFLWDMNVGIGRDLSPKTTLMIWAGGAKGTIKNKERYGPIATDIRFTATLFYIEPELIYYPWGKIDNTAASEARGYGRIRAALAGAKPCVGLAAGYFFVRPEADGKLKAPFIGTFYRDYNSSDHHLYIISPRAGFEMPVGKNTSIFHETAFFFSGPKHSSEYNEVVFSFGMRYTF